MKNIYKKLNLAIDFIEENLYENINLKKIASLLELNINTSNSIFELMTGYTIKDYIRKRRLSESAFLIKKEKIIDVAIMCGYNTREGFSRAFKAFHGHTPSKKTLEINYLEKIVFDTDLLNYTPVQLKSRPQESAKLYGFYKNLSPKNFSAEAENFKNEIKKKFNLTEFYCANFIENQNAKCFVGSLQPLKNSQTLIIKAEEYVCREDGQEISRKTPPELEIYKKDSKICLYRI